jgi:hypothetical protein
MHGQQNIKYCNQSYGQTPGSTCSYLNFILKVTVLWGFLNWCRSVLSGGNVIDTATRLRAGRTGARTPVGGYILISRHIHTGSGAHTIPHVNRYLGWSCRSVTLTTVVLLAPRLRLRGIIPLHLFAFIACTVQLNCNFTSSVTKTFMFMWNVSIELPFSPLQADIQLNDSGLSAQNTLLCQYEDRPVDIALGSLLSLKFYWF